jgi:hypothetical protein
MSASDMRAAITAMVLSFGARSACGAYGFYPAVLSISRARRMRLNISHHNDEGVIVPASSQALRIGRAAPLRACVRPVTEEPKPIH